LTVVTSWPLWRVDRVTSWPLWRVDCDELTVVTSWPLWRDDRDELNVRNQAVCAVDGKLVVGLIMSLINLTRSDLFYVNNLMWIFISLLWNNCLIEYEALR